MTNKTNHICSTPARPWIQHIAPVLQELVEKDLVKQITVQFRMNDDCDMQCDDFHSSVLYFPVGIHSLKESPVCDVSVLSSLLKTLETTLENFGMDVLPSGLLPSTSRKSLALELQKLRDLRHEHVGRLNALEAMLVTHQRAEESDCILDDVYPNSITAKIEKMSKHKENMAKVRLDLQDILKALAGLMAEHKNVTLHEVITEYKSH